MITREAPVSTRRVHLDGWWLLAVGAVVVAVLAASLFSPDLVTGSNHERLPLAGFIDWVWGAVAIGYLAFVRGDRSNPSFALAVAILWVAVAVASIGAPELVTGTDPTRIPIATLVAPIVGVVVTGFLALHATSQRDS